MITGGVIKSVIGNGKYLVSIDIFKTPLTTIDTVFTCTALVSPNMYDCYKADDKVLVDFFRNSASYPVIVGRIYMVDNLNNKDTKYRGTSCLVKLEVKDTAILPYDTKIGDISYSDISNMKKKIDSLEQRIITLEQK